MKQTVPVVPFTVSVRETELEQNTLIVAGEVKTASRCGPVITPCFLSCRYIFYYINVPKRRQKNEWFLN